MWGSSLLLMLLPFADGFYGGYPKVYGHGGDWCWLAAANATTQWEQPAAPKRWKFIIWRVPFLALELWVLYVVAHATFVLRSSSAARMSQQAKTELYAQLAGYPVIMLVTWAFGTIRAWSNDFVDAPVFTSNWAVYMHVVLASGSGVRSAGASSNAHAWTGEGERGGWWARAYAQGMCCQHSLTPDMHPCSA